MNRCRLRSLTAKSIQRSQGGAEGAEKTWEELLTAYEMLLSSLPESDPNYSFFRETIPEFPKMSTGQKSCGVYTGRITDPEVSDSLL